MQPEQGPDIVVVGTSAGGVRALQEVVSALPGDLEAALFVVLHLLAEAESFLPEILTRAGKLPASHPSDGQIFETGRIYAAPPDRHLLLPDSRMRVVRGPKENLHRPSIDVLFRSAANTWGARVVGVLLTGADDDGAAGLKAIQERGGITIVQDPHDSVHPEMPQSALRLVDPDYTLPLNAVGAMVRDLVKGAVKPSRRIAMPEPADPSFGAEEGLPVDDKELGNPTPYSCPDCNGTLWEMQDGNLLRYRCRVGHAYTAASMVEAQAQAVERALWEAVRVLEESASMSRRIAHRTDMLREQLFHKATEREQHALTIRKLLLSTSD
jgi:two-component system chemotaxis response regulator CheB